MAAKTQAETRPAVQARTVTIDGIELRLAQADEMPVLSVGADAAKNQLRACWLTPGGSTLEGGASAEIPLSPRILHTDSHTSSSACRTPCISASAC